MKAIKDCEWEVKIQRYGRMWDWGAFVMERTNGIYPIESKEEFKSKQKAQIDWCKFAQINKIKKWKYV